MSRPSPIDEHLLRVEALGFRRDAFPLRYNGHEIWLLQNDGHLTDDARLFIHFTLYCGICDSEHTIRGRSDRESGWTKAHLQDVKIAALQPFITTECGKSLGV